MLNIIYPQVMGLYGTVFHTVGKLWKPGWVMDMEYTIMHRLITEVHWFDWWLCNFHFKLTPK